MQDQADVVDALSRDKMQHKSPDDWRGHRVESQNDAQESEDEGRQ